MQRIFALAGLVLATGLVAQSPVPLPAYGSTFTGTAATRGFWFTCPTPCIVQGIAVPNEQNQPFQAVEFIDLGTSPPPSYSATMVGTQMFYSNSTAGGSIIPTNIVLQAGEVYGVLGLCTSVQGGGTGYNSYGTPAGAFTSNILGTPVTLTRFGTQSNIAANGGNQPVWQEPAGAISRVELYIVPAAGLYANFTATPTAGPVGMTVNFTDGTFTSDPGGVTSWAWDLDGDSVIDSTAQNPSFTYTACGAYNVTLTVTDASHPSSTVTKTGYIQVGITPITPSFTYASIAPGVFQFTDTSSPVPSSWAWDLDGDGITDSTAQNPVWAYSSPCTSVNVGLSVSSSCAGPWSTTRPIVLSPLSATAVPFAGGNGTTSTTVVGNMFDLQVTAPGGINVCAITQGIYTYIGAFNVDVYVTDGTYIGKEANAAAWRLVAQGTGQANGGPVTPGTPYPVALNHSFYLPSGNYGMVVFLSRVGGAMYVSYTNSPQGPFSNGDVTFNPNPTTAPGRVSTALFTGAGIVGRCWNGTLHYSKAGNGDQAGYGWFGPGCPSSLGVSSLTAAGSPVIGSTLNVTVDNLPLGAAIMATGFSKTNWALGALPYDLAAYGAPGCSLRISPDANLLITGAGNSAVWPFTIPANTGLIGINLYNQAIVLAPGYNGAGAVGSDAAGMMIGL